MSRNDIGRRINDRRGGSPSDGSQLSRIRSRRLELVRGRSVQLWISQQQSATKLKLLLQIADLLNGILIVIAL
jgi:hypothetical protein